MAQEIPGHYFDELMTNVWSAGTSTEYIRMHPVAVYGMILSVVLFVSLCIYAVKVKADGAVFTAYLMMNAIMMFVLEMVRADKAYIWGTEIPVNYVVSGVIVFTIVSGKLRRLQKRRKEKRKLFVPQ